MEDTKGIFVTSILPRRSDFGEKLKFWKTREHKRRYGVVPEFVVKAFEAAGQELQERQAFHRPHVPHRSRTSSPAPLKLPPRRGVRWIWWTMTFLLLIGLLVLLFADQFINLVAPAEDCNCKSLFEIMGWRVKDDGGGI